MLCRTPLEALKSSDRSPLQVATQYFKGIIQNIIVLPSEILMTDSPSLGIEQ